MTLTWEATLWVRLCIVYLSSTVNRNRVRLKDFLVYRISSTLPPSRRNGVSTSRMFRLFAQRANCPAGSLPVAAKIIAE
jgi:hypothetical protein